MSGRVANDQARILDNVELFREFASTHGCLNSPFAFASPHSRVL